MKILSGQIFCSADFDAILLNAYILRWLIPILGGTKNNVPTCILGLQQKNAVLNYETSVLFLSIWL